MLKEFRQKAFQILTRIFSITGAGNINSNASGSSAGESVTPETVLGLSTVWSCVNLLAGVMGSLPWGVYRTNENGGRELVKGHWLNTILKSPNADQSPIDFWEFMQACLELRGNAYALKVYSGKRIVALVPIPPDFVTVSRAGDGRIKYEYVDEARAKRTVYNDQMLHIRGFGGGPLGGLSTLQYARNSFGLALATEKTAASLFSNGLRPAGVLTFQKILTPDQRKDFHDLLRQEYLGAKNANRPLVLEGGTTWSDVSMSPEDTQMLETRGFSVEDVCRFFGVPPVLIGHTEKVSAWGSGITEIILGFIKFALTRRARRIELAISKQLLTAEDRANGIYFEFALEGLLRGAPKERSEFYRTMTGAGIMSVNECRKLENLPPVPGGDVPRLQMQNVPLDAGNDPNSNGTPGA